MPRNDRAIKAYLRDWLKGTRAALGLTQEQMAERLGIVTRSYSDLERGQCGLSAATLLFLLRQLSDQQILRLVYGFPEQAGADEQAEQPTASDTSKPEDAA